MHLAVGSDRVAVSPTETIFAGHVGEHPDVLLGVAAEARKFPFAEIDIGVQLEGLSDENVAEDAVDIENSGAGILLAGVVDKTVGASFGDPLQEAIDQSTGLIFFRETHAVTGD